MPVRAIRHVRRMRGGAQAHLIEASDGGFYVVKFLNNPQHRRILVNELAASVLLAHVGVAHAGWSLIEVTPEFLAGYPDAAIRLGSSTVAIEPGVHFGSKHPGDPDSLAVFDFVPDALLAQVHNGADFLGTLAFDKWVANSDARQAVFFRAALREWDGAAQPGKKGFLALMIDHGFAFNGPHWDFPDAAANGLYHRRLVYERARGLGDFQPWLDRIVNAPEHVFDDVWKLVPRRWIEGDDDALEKVLERLWRRRARVPELIEDCVRAYPMSFPQWK